MKINIKIGITMKKLAILLCFILLVPLVAKGQGSVMDENYFFNHFIGLTGGIGLISYNGSLSLFNEQVDCDSYNFYAKNEFQTNVLFGLRAEWRFSKRFDLYASLLYENRSAKFEPNNYTTSEELGQPELVIVSHLQELNAKINIFSITPMIKYRPFDFDFGILVGPSFAFMVSDELDSKESIIEPDWVYYNEIGERERTIYSGEIENKYSILTDLKFGITYGLMITERIKLSPEIFYVLPLMKVKPEVDWKISSLQFLVSLSYGF